MSARPFAEPWPERPAAKNGKVALLYRGPGLSQDRVTGMELSLRDQTRARIDAFRAEEASKEAARAEWVEFSGPRSRTLRSPEHERW